MTEEIVLREATFSPRVKTYIFFVVFVFGIIRSFLAVTMAPFMSQIISRELYTQSATWNSTAWHVGSILGPVVAGLLYGYHHSFHANWCYAITCMLFLCALFCFSIINRTCNCFGLLCQNSCERQQQKQIK